MAIILTWVTIAYDPVYLTEPMIRSSEYRLALNQQIPPYPCDVVEEVVRPKGVVPHYLPGKNPFLGEFGKKYNLPMEVTLGGPRPCTRSWRARLRPSGTRNESQEDPPDAGRRRRPGGGGVGAAAAKRGRSASEPVRGHIYLLGGAGGNITASIGPDGVLLVDSGLAQNADKVLAAINKLNVEIANRGGLPTTTTVPPKPIRYIINTHLHADHTGGNEKIAEAGKTITGGNVTGEFGDAAEGATIVAQQAVLDRMSQAKPAAALRGPAGRYIPRRQEAQPLL